MSGCVQSVELRTYQRLNRPEMSIIGQPPVLAYAASALVLAFGLVRLGHHVLDLLRDLRKFREGR